MMGIYHEEYYQNHKEQIKQRSSKYYKEHKEEQRQYSKVHYQTHKEQLDKSHKKYRQTHPKYREKAKVYQQTHREQRNKSRRKYCQTHREIIRIQELARKFPKAKKCSFCGSTKNLQRAHFSYLRPEFFLTLCAEHHSQFDKTIEDYNKCFSKEE